MILKQLIAKNFMPYRGNMTIDFPTDRDRNVMIVFGDNMRGKTSLLNALRWAFYGKAIGRHSREIQLLDLVNKEAVLIGEWSMEVVIFFEHDGDDYELRRTATKRALVSVPARSEDLQMERHMRKNGIPLGDHLIDAEINRFAPEQTSRFFLFDGELLDEYEQLLVDGSEQSKEIKDAIEQVLGVPTLVRGRADAQTILKQAQRQQSIDLQKMGGFEQQTANQRHLQSLIESAERDIISLKDRLNHTADERIQLDDFLASTAAYQKVKLQLDSAKDRLKANQEDRDSALKDRLILVKDSWREVLRPLLGLKREHMQADYAKLAQQMTTRSLVESKIKQLEETVKDQVCHTCGQPLHEKERIAAAEELGKLQVDVQTMSVDMGLLTRLGGDMKNLNDLLKPTKALQIGLLDTQIHRLSVQETTLCNEIDELEEQIQGQDTTLIAKNRAMRDRLLQEEARIEQDIRTTQANLEKHQRDLAIISKTLEANPAARAARSTRLVSLASSLDRIYGKSIERLRDDLKATVERLATDAFMKLTSQKKYSGLRINGNYGLTILDERGQDVAVRSAGAEQIVALSLIDGLSHAGRSAGPVVMDTPFGRLDKIHRANILEYLPTTSSQLVLFVHEGEIDKASDLARIRSRIGCVYQIKEVTPSHSRIERITQ